MIVSSLKIGRINVNSEIKRKSKVVMFSCVAKCLKIWMVVITTIKILIIFIPLGFYFNKKLLFIQFKLFLIILYLSVLIFSSFFLR